MADTPFDDLTDVYEAMIDWPKRLAAEEPFYRRLFEDLSARSVVDVACGTGRHAAMFHSWGMRVEGSDISPRMIQRASAHFAPGPRLCWVVRGFDEPIPSQKPYDAAICVGNSLALAPDPATAKRAVREMLRAVGDQGVVVVHVLNLWPLPDGPCVWQKCKPARLPGGEAIIVKGVHRCGGQGFVELVVIGLEGDVAMRSRSARFLGIEADELDRIARTAGAKDVQFFGGYRNQPYERATSTDLVMVARK